MINKIKKYFFYRRFRYYRKDEMTIQFIKHRLTSLRALRLIDQQDKEKNLMAKLIENQKELIALLKEQNDNLKEISDKKSKLLAIYEKDTKDIIHIFSQEIL